MAEEIYIELREEQYLQAIFSRPADAVTHPFRKNIVIFVHDFPGDYNGTENSFSELQDLLLKNSHSSLRFNHRGCGKSDGQTLNFTISQAQKDLETIIAWVENQGYEKITLITEGLACFFAHHETLPKSVKNTVLLWPAFNFHEYLERYYHLSEYSDELKNQGFYKIKQQTIGKLFVDGMTEIDHIKFANSIKLPTLTFHGKEDQVVPIANLNVVREHLGAKRIDITTFDDGTHGLPAPNHRKAVATHILHFIERYSLK